MNWLNFNNQSNEQAFLFLHFFIFFNCISNIEVIRLWVLWARAWIEDGLILDYSYKVNKEEQPNDLFELELGDIRLMISFSRSEELDIVVNCKGFDNW